MLWLGGSVIFLQFFGMTPKCLHRWLEECQFMSMTVRILIAAGVFVLDLAVVFIPLTALFMVYILLYNPPWFREFLNNLDAPAE
jgi:hypothetical protein